MMMVGSRTVKVMGSGAGWEAGVGGVAPNGVIGTTAVCPVVVWPAAVLPGLAAADCSTMGGIATVPGGFEASTMGACPQAGFRGGTGGINTGGVYGVTFATAGAI